MANVFIGRMSCPRWYRPLRKPERQPERSRSRSSRRPSSSTLSLADPAGRTGIEIVGSGMRKSERARSYDANRCKPTQSGPGEHFCAK